MNLIWGLILACSPGDERGQDLVEYALLIGLVALLVIGVSSLLGTNFGLLLGDIADEVGP